MTIAQTWSNATGTGFLGADRSNPSDAYVVAASPLSTTQAEQVEQAMGLWDDVSAFTVTQRPDDTNQAREATTLYRETSWFGLSSHTYWGGNLPGDWTRVAIGELRDPDPT